MFLCYETGLTHGEKGFLSSYRWPVSTSTPLNQTFSSKSEEDSQSLWELCGGCSGMSSCPVITYLKGHWVNTWYATHGSQWCWDEASNLIKGHSSAVSPQWSCHYYSMQYIFKWWTGQVLNYLSSFHLWNDPHGRLLSWHYETTEEDVSATSGQGHHKYPFAENIASTAETHQGGPFVQLQLLHIKQ